MNYYKHNIGDYRRDTSHLTLLEHGIYRQMLDQYYLDEKPLNADKDRLMRSLCIRSADELQAAENVLKDFFKLTKNGYEHVRCERELQSIYDKSNKARESAKSRWSDKNQQLNNSNNANASETHSERNANGMLPITHNPLPITHKKEKSSRFAPPSIEELTNYINENQLSIDANDFINFYESKNWMVGKNKMKDWKASARGWHSRNKKKGKENEQSGDKPKTASARFMENMRNTWND